MMKGIIFMSIVSSLLGLFGFSKQSTSSVVDDEQWLITQKTYEGLPLFLRRPVKLNYDDVARLYPKLIIITHHLSNVMPNGIPDAKYNESLFDLDGYIVTYLLNKKQGVTVLVETFGGDRSYYCYAVDDFILDIMKKDVEIKYPGNNLEWIEKKDEDAKFIRRYAKEQLEFPPDENADVLRRMQENGDDLSKPRMIEFCFAFPQRPQAIQFASIVDDKDLTVAISEYSERDIWQVIVSKHMLPTHADITTMENKLTRKAQDVGGEADGWGCFKVG